MAPSRQGQAWSHRLLWVLSLCLTLVSPAPVWADLYTWVDDRGVQNIVDDPTRIPERFRRQARLFLTSSASRRTESPSTGSGQAPSTSSGQAPSTGLPRAESRGSGQSPLAAPPASETQGSVAVALAERLALAHRPSPLQAANALLERGILPPAGWMLDEPIDPGWMADLARSLLAASSAGRLPQTPESTLRTLEGVAAERGIAVVAFEPPPPPQPQVIVAQPAAVIVQTVFVPAFPLHTRHGFLDARFQRKRFNDHPHPWQHFPKNHGAGQHHPMDLRPRHPANRFDNAHRERFDGGFDGEPSARAQAEWLSRTAHRGGKIAEFPPVGSHGVQSGSTVLTAGGSTVLTTSGSTLSSAEGLTTGGREKRSGATRCASSGMGHSVRICP